MGSSSMSLREALFTELKLDRHKPLRFTLGELLVEVPRAD
jgi:hypothetical protein